MKKAKNLLLTVLLLTSALLSAQPIGVRGTIISSSDSSPVVGAFVGVKGNNSIITATDIDGNFSLSQVPQDAILVISMMGFEEMEVSVNGRSIINISLKESVEFLEQVVVVGYGSMKKSDLTGSVSSIKSDRLNESIITNADQFLQGRVAGVQITQNSGAPGGASSIRIRGASSINNTNEPLYIIDGIPFAGSGNEIGGFEWSGGTNGQRYVNPLSAIAPSDIVSIDILKDASATAIYGANGANGVILITTKRGKAGQTNISYDGFVTAQQVAKKLDMMNLREYAQYQLELGEFIQQTPNEAFRDPSILGKGTDWQDEIFRTALMHSHQLSFTGGSEKVQFALTGGYMTQDGIVIGSDFNRFNTRVNIDGNVYRWLKVGGSLAFSKTKETITNNDGTDGVIMQALTMQPNIPVYNFDGTWAGPNSVNGASQYNPVWLAMMKNNLYQRERIMANFYLSADLLKGLNFRSEFGFDSNNNNNTAFVPTYSFGVITNNINQVLQRYDNSYYWIWKNYATYDVKVDKHTFIAMAGAELSQSTWSGHQFIKQNMTTDDIKMMTNDGDFVSNRGWAGRGTMASFFARINYNYNEKYLLTATFRADGSSKFGPNNKWGYFPSVSLAWRINNENFFKNSFMNGFVSNLKLRVGYGQVGNSNIGNYLYGSAMQSINTPLGTGYHMKNIANPDLKWEASESYNIGLDMGFLDERISVTADIYQKDTKDLLLQVSVPSYLGGTQWNDIQTPMVNIGKTRNKGLDITINTLNISREKFSWNSHLVISMNRNKVLALNDPNQKLFGAVDWWSEFQTATITQVGSPIGVFYGYVAEGIFKSEEDVLKHAVQVADPNNSKLNLFNQNTGVYIGDIKFKDLNKDGVIDEKDQKIIGDPNPDLTLGFSNNFTLGQWDLGLVLTGAYGFDILNFARTRTEGMTSIWDNQSTAVNNRALVGTDEIGNKYLINTGTDTPRPSTNDFNRNNRMSTRFIEDGSYLRIQNISVGYRLPSAFVKRMGIQSFKLYLNIQNLYTLTNYSGYDPEIGAYNQSALLQNIDRGRYPSPRSVTFGVNIGF